MAWIGVEKGDMVKEGQVLVRLEDDEYRAQLLEAQGQLNNLKAHLAELEHGSRPEEIAKAKADLEQAHANKETRGSRSIAPASWPEKESCPSRRSTTRRRSTTAPSRM